MIENELPTRVRVLILGGGIHGVGVLHDLASRGWTDVHLVEMNEIGSGTSSKSTKLIHGGLRYLKRISQFGMVSESLRERGNLLNLAPDLVTPIEIMIPVLNGKGTSSIMIRVGLALYDFLAHKLRIQRYKKLSIRQAQSDAPMLDLSRVSSVYSYWDAQTDDLALVQRIAANAKKCGCQLTEHCRVESIKSDDDGWVVEVRQKDGQLKKISALYVVNCLGPWANKFLEESSIIPTHKGINDKGVHLIVKDLGLKKGVLLQSPEDQRIFFMLPWKGFTLVGTTEETFNEDPSSVGVDSGDVDYLLERCNRYMNSPIVKKDVIATFAGLRWLAQEDQNTISTVSRESIVGERFSRRGILMTIYGGKLTSYRLLCEKIGDRITQHFGEFRESKTEDKNFWVDPDEAEIVSKTVEQRFSFEQSKS
jgi:glycerol-3-phosphate dehydrogenase